MSSTPSISTSSTSSSNATHRMPSNGQDDLDPSNRLYNDHHNYQIIFSNDSRFFDTSLHLYKSYRKLGYIQASSRNKNNGSRTNLNATLTKPTNNIANSKSSGVIHHHHDHRNYTDNNTTLKPPTRIANDQEYASNSSNVRLSRVIADVPLGDDRPWPTRNPNENGNHNNGNDDDDYDDDDDADIIITKL